MSSRGQWRHNGRIIWFGFTSFKSNCINKSASFLWYLVRSNYFCQYIFAKQCARWHNRMQSSENVINSVWMQKPNCFLTHSSRFEVKRVWWTSFVKVVVFIYCAAFFLKKKSVYKQTIYNNNSTAVTKSNGHPVSIFFFVN